MPILEVGEVREVQQGSRMVELIADATDKPASKIGIHGAGEDLASYSNRVLHCVEALHDLKSFVVLNSVLVELIRIWFAFGMISSSN
jgi:hypothetical protein